MDRKKMVALISLLTIVIIVFVIFIFGKSNDNGRIFDFRDRSEQSEESSSDEMESSGKKDNSITNSDENSSEHLNNKSFGSESLTEKPSEKVEKEINISSSGPLDPFSPNEEGNIFRAAKKFENITAKEKQAIGNIPVDVYAHPKLKLFLDLRDVKDISKSLYVIPVDEGFEIIDRHEMSIKSIGEEELLKMLEDEGNIFSLYHVKKIDDEMAEYLDNQDKFEVKIGYVENDLYAVYRDKKSAEKFDKLKNQMGDDAINSDLIFSKLKVDIDKDKELSQESKEKEEDSDKKYVEQVKLEWEDFKKIIAEKPSKIEWKYLLPLYAKGEYNLEGKDVRRIVPSSKPIYSVGSEDIDGNGREELILHCSMRKETEYGVEGYWAILIPSKSGLITSSIYNYGNGDMLIKDKNLFFTSLSRIKEGVSFQLIESTYPKNKKFMPIKVDFLQPKGLGHSLSGKKLSEDYPNHYILEHEGQLFLVMMQDYDYLMDYAQNRVKGAVRLRLEDEGVSRLLITNINEYLTEAFTNLPFSSEDWKRAKPVAGLANIRKPITFQDFR